ncbi:MAG TPA: hypothetical protein PL143_15655 [Rhodocyclaceae bacterium]|nr:hypothetical protein [Rhodocyclaceae bacterium]
MLTLADCLDFIDLDQDTIDVIAEYEKLPPIVAAELGDRLLASRRGIYRLHDMYRELIARAAATRTLEREKALRRAYAAFTRKYPMPRHL